MSRRATLPGADELFRRTSETPEPTDPTGSTSSTSSNAVPTAPEPSTLAAVPAASSNMATSVAAATLVEPEAAVLSAPLVGTEPVRTPRPTTRRRPKAGDRRPTGRERHEEKITVYVSPEELVDIEQAKLILRAQHGLAVDRGRIVREAIAVVIADLEAQGEDSILVRRLRGV